MISANDVEPYDKDALEWIAKWEAIVDDALKKTNAWGNSFDKNTERWAEIARRYAAEGWHVRIVVSGARHQITIMHPMWAFPDGLIAKPM